MSPRAKQKWIRDCPAFLCIQHFMVPLLKDVFAFEIFRVLVLFRKCCAYIRMRSNL